jgi:hypothetical protein
MLGDEMEDEITLKRLSTVQDFFSKRAVAHASFFVASIFGLFTILSLMEKFVNRMPFYGIIWQLAWDWNFARFLLLSSSYWFIWLFGLYSFANFGYYATLAQRTEEKIAEGKEIEIIDETKKKLGRRLSWFYGFKSGLSQRGLSGWIRSHGTILLSILYFLLIGLFPFISLLSIIFL